MIARSTAGFVRANQCFSSMIARATSIFFSGLQQLTVLLLVGLSDVGGGVLLGLSVVCIESLMAKRGFRDSVAGIIRCACYRASTSILGPSTA